MPSPFPGMNPFLEQTGIWTDFRLKYLAALNEALTTQVRPGGMVLLRRHREESARGEPMPYLEILDRKDRHLVAVIELLSPSNKRGRDRDQYLAKREAVLRSEAHLIEIDLLRGGPTLPPARPASTYSVLVSRAGQRPRAGLWPIALRDRLPVVPVPLMAPDPDARLDLQAALDRVYDAYGYDDFLYDNRPDPPLTVDEEAWASGFLSGDGR